MAELEPFPRARFEIADATDAEIDQLEREYERSDLGVQHDMLEHFRSQSTGGLRDYLANLREIGHFTEGPESALDGDSGPSGAGAKNAPKTLDESGNDPESTPGGSSDVTE